MTSEGEAACQKPDHQLATASWSVAEGGGISAGGRCLGGWGGQTVAGQSEDDDGEKSLRDAQPQHDDAGVEGGHGGCEVTELRLLCVSDEQQWDVIGSTRRTPKHNKMVRL